MHRKMRDYNTRCRRFLVDELDILYGGILRKLREKNVLKEEHEQVIKAEKTAHGQIDKLIDILRTQCDEHFYSFWDIVSKENSSLVDRCCEKYGNYQLALENVTNKGKKNVVSNKRALKDVTNKEKRKLSSNKRGTGRTNSESKRYNSRGSLTLKNALKIQASKTKKKKLEDLKDFIDKKETPDIIATMESVGNVIPTPKSEKCVSFFETFLSDESCPPVRAAVFKKGEKPCLHSYFKKMEGKLVRLKPESYIVEIPKKKRSNNKFEIHYWYIPEQL